MKFRIMQDGNGKYVQKKNMFGIWRNWLIYNNSTTFGKMYYNYSDDEIMTKVSNKVSWARKMLREFTV